MTEVITPPWCLRMLLFTSLLTVLSAVGYAFVGFNDPDFAYFSPVLIVGSFALFLANVAYTVVIRIRIPFSLKMLVAFLVIEVVFAGYLVMLSFH